jgi:Trypsin-co-occurring domain 2
VGLADAIESLRLALAAALWDGKQRRVRFKVGPVKLTMQVGLT